MTSLNQPALDTASPQIKKDDSAKTCSLADVPTYLKAIKESGISPGLSTFYRGHESSCYKLKPSVFRDQNFTLKEHVFYDNILAYCPNDFGADSSTFEKLVRMQHYAVPTRLLDVTSNPLVALYFACQKVPRNDISPDGEVVIFQIEETHKRVFSSDTVTCLANLARIDESERENILKKAREYDTKVAKAETDECLSVSSERSCYPDVIFSDVYTEPHKGSWDLREEFCKQSQTGRLFHFIKEEKPYFERVIHPRHLLSVFHVLPKMNNQRIVAQAGSFLIFGLDKEMLENGNANGISIYRIKIPHEAKKDILTELAGLNINDATLLPSIDTRANVLRKEIQHLAGIFSGTKSAGS